MLVTLFENTLEKEWFAWKFFSIYRSTINCNNLLKRNADQKPLENVIKKIKIWFTVSKILG